MRGTRVAAGLSLMGFAAACSLHPSIGRAGTVSPLPASDYTVRSACAAPAPGNAGCLARLLVASTAAARAHTHPLGITRSHAIATAAASEGAFGLRPQDLRSAYFPGEQPDAPASEPQTIALVDAYNDLDAEADLKVYDEEFGLPECTAGNGCFEQVNQSGEAANLPFPQSAQSRQEMEALCEDGTAEPSVREAACHTVQYADGWALEISLDIEVAHAVCRNCHVVLVEADNGELSNLEAAEDAAAHLGSEEISNSWGGEEPLADGEAFNHPGIAITVASGDSGYLNWAGGNERAEEPGFGEGFNVGGVDYPASSPHVVAVGGTHLTLTGPAETWSGETVWNDSGGGCSVGYTAQEWQRDVPGWSSVGCEGRRAVADVSADADPFTGVAVYDSNPYVSPGSGLRAATVLGWTPLGGTSVSSPIIAAMFALAGGAHGVEYPAQTLYSHIGSASQHDVVEGGNGKCDDFYASGCSGSMNPLSLSDCGQGASICNAAAGYDGPSGVGTPNGIEAFKPARQHTGGSGPEAPITEACSGPIGAGAEQRVCGTLNPHTNAKAGYYFAYNKGTSCTGGKETAPMAEVQGEAIPVSGELTGLEPDTRYAYCLIATDATGETSGSALTFTTEPAAPKAPQTLAPTGVTSDSATFNGTLRPEPIATSWYFEYAAGASCTGAAAKTTPEQQDAMPDQPDAVSAPATELRPATEYTVCLVAKNRIGSTEGSGVSFETNLPTATLGGSLSWSAPTPIDSSFFTPTSVSCATRSFCVATGSEGDAETFAGGTWSAPALIDGYERLESVSCASPSFCAAVDSSGHALTYGAGAWSAPAAIDGDGGLSSVACGSDSACVAVDVHGNAVAYAGGAWSAPTLIDGSGGLRSVSCPSASSCAAVDSGGRALTYSAGVWSAPASVDTEWLTSVSCGSESFCVAVDLSGHALTYASGAWSAPTPIDGREGLSAVSCQASSFCVAVDSSGYELTYSGGAWSAPALIDVSGGRLESVSCPSASFCVAVDEQERALTFSGGSAWARTALAGEGLASVSCPSASFCVAFDSNGRALTYAGGAWSAPIEVDGNDELQAVSCASASFCAAVDNLGYAVTLAGGAWGAPALIDGAGGLTSVSCPSASFCVAVDEQGDAVTFDGHSWSPPTPIYGNSGLRSVSCPSASFCVAVSTLGEALTFHDGSWSAPVSVDGGKPIELSSISCPSASFCAAVSDSGKALTFDGGAWSAPVKIDSVGDEEQVGPVSCPSASFCVTVDSSGNAVTFAGGAWGGPARIHSEGGLSSISCPSASFCAAVATDGDALIASEPLPPPVSIPPPAISPSAAQGGPGPEPGASQSGSAGPSGAVGSGGAAPHVSVSAVRLRGDLLLIPLSCRGGAGSSCTVTFTLTVVEKLRRGRLVAVSAATAARRRAREVGLVVRTVIVGRRTVALRAGESEVVRVALNATGRRLLNARRVLAVNETASEDGVRLSSRIVRFRAPARRAHRRRCVRQAGPDCGR